MTNLIRFPPRAPGSIDPRYLPLFRKAAELGVYVYLHPQLPEGSRYAGYGFTFAGPGLGFTVDTVTTLLRMVVSGLFDEIPSLRLVLGHLGEGLPFLLDRIENRIDPRAAMAAGGGEKKKRISITMKKPKGGAV